MKSKWLIILITFYLIAFITNLIPSIKYPDTTMNILNLTVTILFLMTLLIFTKKASYNSKSNKGLKTILLLGFISGIVVYVIKRFEETMLNYVILDMIASIQYPLYLIFTTPLFGLNYLFQMNYGIFSLLMSAVYVISLILVMRSKK